jgi:hypothetical protein
MLFLADLFKRRINISAAKWRLGVGHFPGKKNKQRKPYLM